MIVCYIEEGQYLYVTTMSLENNLPTFRLNVLVETLAKLFSIRPAWWQLEYWVKTLPKLFSELKLITDNLPLHLCRSQLNKDLEFVVHTMVDTFLIAPGCPQHLYLLPWWMVMMLRCLAHHSTSPSTEIVKSQSVREWTDPVHMHYFWVWDYVT